MPNIKRAVAVATILLTTLPCIALAQDRGQDDHHKPAQRDSHSQDGHSHYVHHSNWRRGGRISHDDWQRGQVVDYRSHHLRQPPRGYEWREVDGNYVLAAVATGVIASVIIASQSH